MKNKKKPRFAAAALLALLGLFLWSGCVTVSNQDYARDYKTYLKYSLGEYALEKSEYRRTSTPIPHIYRGKQWKASFLDGEGNGRLFVFHNIDPFQSQVVRYALEEAERQIKDRIITNHFTYEEQKDLRIFVSVHIPQYWENPQIISPKKGLRLSHISPEELWRNWNARFRFSAMERSGDPEIRQKLQGRIENMMRDVIACGNNPDFTFFLQGEHSDDSYTCFFQQKENGFLWRLQGDILDEENTKNGRLQMVRRLYIGDKLYIMENGGRYHEETGEYHISPLYLYAALEDFQIEKENIDAQRGIYGWNIGEKHFELDSVEKTLSIDGKNILSYPFDHQSGINMSAFAAMLDTGIRYDGRLRAIVVESASKHGPAPRQTKSIQPRKKEAIPASS